MYPLWVVTGSCNAVVLGVGLVYRMWLVVFCASVIAAAVGLGVHEERERERVRAQRAQRIRRPGVGARRCRPVTGRRVPQKRQP